MGSCSTTRAILTVNSPLRLTNSRVPSRGSTTQSSRQVWRSAQGAWADSSERIGMWGVTAVSPSRMTRCDSRSARVKGELSSLCCTVKPASYTRMMAAPARSTMGMRPLAKACRSRIGWYHTHMHTASAVDWSAIDTVLLDMDGTLLDLRFDNWFWLELIPRRYAAAKGLKPAAAQELLAPKFVQVKGTLQWYCIEYWTRELGLDIGG